MPEDVLIKVEFRGDIAHLSFNRPSALNAINVPMAIALRDAVSAVTRRDGVRVILLSGEGRSFMAGGDVAQFNVRREDAPAAAEQLITPVHEALRLLNESLIPVVARVQGVVAGVGLAFVLAADIVVASSDVRFEVGYTKLGTSPDGGSTWTLPRVIGLRRALEFALLPAPVFAEEALNLGLVTRIVSPEGLSAEIEMVTAKIASGPTVALGEARRLLRGTFDRTFSEQLDEELRSFRRCSVTNDFRAGVGGFLAKERVAFAGS